MANKYTRKKPSETQREDEFVSFWHKMYDAVSPHLRAIAYGLAGAVGLFFVVYGGTQWWNSSKQAATEQLGRALRIQQAELLVLDEKAEKPPEKEGDVPRFKTAKERADAVIAELDKLDKEHGSSEAAHRGRLARAGTYYDLARYEEAETAFKKYLDDASKDDAARPVAIEGIGISYEARGKLDEALAKYQEAEKAGGEYFRDRALYDQARIYVAKGDKKKAAEVYRDILAKSPQSPLRDDINARLAQLEG